MSKSNSENQDENVLEQVIEGDFDESKNYTVKGETRRVERKQVGENEYEETEIIEVEYEEQPETKGRTAQNQENSAENNRMDMFSEVIESNAKRMQKQFEEIEHSAKNFISSLLSVLRNYDSIKHYLQKNSNQFFNKVCWLIGFRYQSQIKALNFFHFASQAIILEEFKAFKTTKYENANFSYIVKQIQENEINDDNYLNNLEILTGSLYSSTPVIKVSENKIAMVFLKNCRITKGRVLSELPEEVTREDFEAAVMKVFKQACSMTLYELHRGFDISAKQDDSEDLQYSFYNVYELLGNPGQQEYLDRLEEDHGESLSVSNRDFKLLAKSFYDFSQCQYSELANDLNSFTLFSSSIKQKLYALFRNESSKISGFAKRLYLVLKEASGKTAHFLRLNDLLCFYDRVYCDCANNSCSLVSYGLKNVEKLRVWVEDSCWPRLKTVPFVFASKVGSFLANYSTFVEAKLYEPLRGVLVSLTGPFVQIMVDTKNFSCQKVNELVNLIAKTANTVYKKSCKVFLNGEEPVKVSFDEEKKYIRVEINQKMLFVSPKTVEKFNQFVSSILSGIVKFVSAQYEMVGNAASNTLGYLSKKYRYFLDADVDAEVNSLPTDKIEMSQKKKKHHLSKTLVTNA